MSHLYRHFDATNYQTKSIINNQNVTRLSGVLGSCQFCQVR